MQSELVQNQKYHGFRLLDVTPCPDYSGTGYLFRHEETGLEVYHLKSSNKECFFTYTVYTPPTNDTGVFHILEHTLLTGSRKYPVRDPFMSMARNSCNTFLNAMTSPDRTDYPAASPVKKDFDNIFSVYTDAVFQPLLRKESFMQEGIRLSSEGGIHFEGVVFSEMQGDISSHESVVQNATSRPLFDEDSPYRHEFGGNPPDICDLTYEEFVATYRKHYCPRNMMLFLYGDLDVTEYLALLDDEYLKGRDPGERLERASFPKPWTKPQKVTATSNADDGDEGASLMVSWLLGPVDDPRLNTELSLLVDILLGNPGCPLYRRIVESGIGRDISNESGMTDYYRNLSLSVGFCGSEEAKAEKAEETILKALQDIVEEGLNPRLVESALRRMEFRLQEISEGLPEGYRIYFPRVDKGWVFGRNPSEMLQTTSMIQSIRKDLKENPRYFEDWIQKNLLENQHRLLSVITMDPETQKRMDDEIARKVELHQEEFDAEEEKKYLEFEETEDTEEDVRKLPRLSLSDIPNERLMVPRTEKGNVVETVIPTCGIVYGDFVFDVSDLSLEDLQIVSLLSRVLLMSNVGTMSYSDFLTELRFCTGAFSALLESGSDCEGKEHDYLMMRFKSLKEYYKDALALVEKLIKEGVFSDKERVAAALRDIQSDYESSVVRQAHSYAIGAASQYYSGSLYTTEQTQGIGFWSKVKEMLSGDLEPICRSLEEMARRILVSSRLTYHLTVSPEDEDAAYEATEAFIASLPVGEKGEPMEHVIPKEAAEWCGYSFSSPVSYSALVGMAPDVDDPDQAAERMLLSQVSRNSLWALIREKGGAYGAGAGLDVNENIFYFYTYRDPRLDASVRDFRKAVLSETLEEDKLEDSKLKVLSRDVKPVGPQAKGLVDLRRYIYGVTDELRARLKDSQLAVTVEDLERVRKKTAGRLDKENTLAVFADAKALKASKLKLKVKTLPFG
ncbi:MAG: insulinase family protein [Spirochaetales bacterium]|nr:insulinase family protein [Candidatus Physcosoma equi]